MFRHRITSKTVPVDGVLQYALDTLGTTDVVIAPLRDWEHTFELAQTIEPILTVRVVTWGPGT